MNQKNQRAPRIFRLSTGVVVAMCALFGPGSPAYAQVAPTTNARRTAAPRTQELRAVIVTATRRRENIQVVPESISVLSGRNLSLRNIMSAQQYTSTIPGLSFNETGFGARNGLDLTIRGISNTRLADTTAGTGALTTGFYINDVAVMPVNIFLYDINRISVLKGPQGTLFGQASMGGTVRVITNEPDLRTYSGQAEMTAAQTSGGAPSWSTRGYLNFPLVPDKLAARVVVYNEDDGGWINWFPASLAAGAAKGPIPTVPAGFPNPITTTLFMHNNVNSTKTFGGRISILYKPTDNLTINPMYMYQERNSPFSSFIERNLQEGYLTQNYQKEPRDEQFTDASLTIHYHFPLATLTSISARFDRDYSWRQDTSAFIGSIYGLTASGGIPSASFLDFHFRDKVLSQELRLTSPTSKYFDWLVGAAYFDESRPQSDLWLAPNFNQNVAPGGGIPGGGAEGFIFATNYLDKFFDRSVYGDVTLKLFHSRLQLSAGVRHYKESYNQRDVATGALVGAVGTTIGQGALIGGSESGTIPRFAIKYMLSPAKMLYAAAAQGFRAGAPGSPNVTQTPACQNALQLAHVNPAVGITSDHLWNYEVGFKGTWDEGRLVTDISAFYIDWTNLQTTLILNNYNNGCAGVAATNGGTAYSRGGDFSITYHPFDNLILRAVGAYTAAELGKQPAGSTVGKEGTPLQNAPKLQGTLSVQYNFGISQKYEGFLRGDESYYGSQWSNQASEPNPFFYVHARSLMDLRFGFQPRDGNWTTQLYVDNALNREQEFGAQSYFGEPMTNQVLVGRPRTVGLMANYSW